MVARYIAHAAGIAKYRDWDGVVFATNRNTELFHLSLPWGQQCGIATTPAPYFNKELLVAGSLEGKRLMVNITSHINTLLKLGHDPVAVIVRPPPVVWVLVLLLEGAASCTHL